MRSLALTPTWSVATVLTIFVAISFLVERSIHRLSSWLQKTNRKPLLAAVEKMKEELMLLGFISLLLTASSSMISNICIRSKFYDSKFAPCTISVLKRKSSQHRNLLMVSVLPHSFRRMLSDLNEKNTCSKDHEPFVSYQGLEQLHRFIFVMAITHISYSCLTMLLAIVKIHSWRVWEIEAHMDRHGSLTEITREQTLQRQSAFVKFHASNPLVRNSFLVWVTCFFRQFGHSVVRADYLTLREGFIMNHNLKQKYDFHGYMVRSMEEEFQMIVGVSGPLWGFVVAFMLFDVNGSNLYFWIAIIPIALVLLVGTKLQHVIATLALENAGITGFFTGAKLRPRDDLFWFKKPELLLSLIHFILFQNAFELASFFWFWWQFGYNSCFIGNHLLVYIRLALGFAGQFLCSYSTLPLYALVTQMGTNYKAALIPQGIRETVHVWRNKARRRRLGIFTDNSTVHTDTSMAMSIEEDHELLDDALETTTGAFTEIEMQPTPASATNLSTVANETSSRVGAPLLQSSASVSSSVTLSSRTEGIPRSYSLPTRR
ncbi:MLO-like protein 11 isoform X2 [Juglans microcarpa x Juglans regia]|uniref:MLO-like protein 11 isoform X2 n=1 Tax=Juglans microcarpa x Juglans regia TaxID=2249226 RepID=UPI001B7F4B31|nr:MLO-like protein 11 isoform X2 [Juglans microcarpa x Juglans regia]